VWFDSGNIVSDGTGFLTANSFKANANSYLSTTLFYGNLQMQSGTTTSLDNGSITSNGSGSLTLTGGVTCGYLNYTTSAPLNIYEGGGTSNGLQIGRTSGDLLPYINVLNSAGGLGFKVAGVAKAEIKNSGNFLISGTQYQTSSGSVSTASGISFDAFDVGEVYPTDSLYPGGTVVCPGPNNQLTQCTHDNCFAALVVSPNPGLQLGTQTDSSAYISGPAQQSIALAGRVNVKTAFDILPRTMIVSDGRGGVRAAASGEAAFVLGVTLNETSGAQVGIMLKSYFGVVS
jgi:hypothetical protein